MYSLSFFTLSQAQLIVGLTKVFLLFILGLFNRVFFHVFWSTSIRNVVKYELKFRNRQIQIANQATCFDFSPMETHVKIFL